MLFIVVASVHNGLLVEVHGRYMNVVPHAFVPQGTTPFDIEEVSTMDGVVGVEQFFRGAGMIVTSESSYVLQLYGISEAESTSAWESAITGDFADLKNNGVALNDRLADDLGLTIGDRVSLTLTRPRENGIQPLFASFRLVATFEFGVDIDYSVAFTSLSNIENRDLVDTGELGYRVWLSDYMNADQLFTGFPDVETWSDEYGELFLGFQLEKLMLSVFMGLVILLASFNLVAAQTMVVNTKRSDIAILTTMGASDSFVFRIFALQGTMIAVTGISIGIILGIVISLNAGTIMNFIEGVTQVTYVQYSGMANLPADIDLVDVLSSVLVAVVTSVGAVVYPVRKFLSASPVDSLNQQA